MLGATDGAREAGCPWPGLRILLQSDNPRVQSDNPRGDAAMDDAWIPILIFGFPLLGLIFLSAIYKGGTSASFAEDGEAPVSPLSGHVSPGAISTLSGRRPPGAISSLSGRKSPGSISRLSGHKSPGSISRLSGRKSPGSISRLSGRKSPGSISSLSAPRPVGAIGSLSGRFFVSNLLGLPLLTRDRN